MHQLPSRAWPLAFSILLFACSHDLHKLTANRGNVGPLHGGTGGMMATLPPPEDAGTPDTGTTTSPAACEPCDDVPDAAAPFMLRSCCRGVSNRECGLTVGDGTLCLARMVPGQSDTACASVRQPSGTQLDGCCRPDGRCGLQADAFQLGCVARDEILPALGALRAEPVPCDYECTVDSDCAAAAGHFVCAEDPKDDTRKHRICVNDCRHDLDCPKDQVCAIANDLGMNRVLAFCQAPIGMGEPGDRCASPLDCAHGVCLRFPNNPNSLCSRFCTGGAECPAKLPACVEGYIDRPDGGPQQTFQTCQLPTGK